MPSYPKKTAWFRVNYSDHEPATLTESFLNQIDINFHENEPVGGNRCNAAWQSFVATKLNTTVFFHPTSRKWMGLTHLIYDALKLQYILRISLNMVWNLCIARYNNWEFCLVSFCLKVENNNSATPLIFYPWKRVVYLSVQGIVTKYIHVKLTDLRSWNWLFVS